MPGHSHIRFGVIRRKIKETAIARLAYQTCDSFVDSFGKRGDYRAYKPWHRGTAVLLPRGANSKFALPANFRKAVTECEKRRDAQEGRTIDITLPREVPPGLELLVLAWALLPLIEMGMSVQIDVERPDAYDGADNPHGHIYLAQRNLGFDGFGEKNRIWNRIFKLDSARHMRAFLASRITAACALLGIAAFVDPRSNAARGLLGRERRFSQKLWRKAERGEYVPALEALAMSRFYEKQLASRQEEKVEDAVTRVSAGDDHNVALGVRQERVWQFARVAYDAGVLIYNMEEYELGCDFFHSEIGRFQFDGAAFVGKRNGSAEACVALLTDCACAFGWRSFVVNGDQALADALVVSGARNGLVPVNLCASEGALGLIAEPNGERLLRDIAGVDPLNAVPRAMAEYRAKAPALEPNVIVSKIETVREIPPDELVAAATLAHFIPEFPTPRSVVISKKERERHQAEQDALRSIAERRNRDIDELLAPYIADGQVHRRAASERQSEKPSESKGVNHPRKQDLEDAPGEPDEDDAHAFERLLGLL